jgi:hypothetical protein
MTTTDPYRIADPAGHAGPRPSTAAPARTDVLRLLLWTLVVVSALCNMAASIVDATMWVHLLCGVVTLVSGGTLVARSVQHRR